MKETDSDSYLAGDHLSPKIASSREDTLRRIASIAQLILRELDTDTLFSAYARAEVDGHERHYFVVRGPVPTKAPITADSFFCNYFAPMGRVTEIEPGCSIEVKIPKGPASVRLLAKNIFVPKNRFSAWDAMNNNIFLEKDVFNVHSLQQYLKQLKEEAAHPGLPLKVTTPGPSSLATSKAQGPSDSSVRSALTEEQPVARCEHSPETYVRRGLSRDVRSKMELRDQYILDGNQGALFRLPVSRQLIITGAPGTGKTTTLIKRISQKTSPENLEEEDSSRVPSNQLLGFFNKENWTMFVPNRLLRTYLKEAFSRESVPATDRNVRTWSEEREILARDVLRFLRVGDSGLFRTTSQALLVSVDDDSVFDLCTRFSSYYHSHIFKRVNSLLRLLPEGSVLRVELRRTLDSLPSNLNVEERVFRLIQALTALYQSNPQILIEMASFRKQATTARANVRKIVAACAKNEGYEDIISLLQTVPHRSQRRSLPVEKNLEELVCIFCKQFYINGQVSATGPEESIYELLKDLLPPESILSNIGASLRTGEEVAFLAGGYKVLLDRVPQYYRRFRLSVLRTEEEVFRPDSTELIENGYIGPQELDILIFCMLKSAHRIFEAQKGWLSEHLGLELLDALRSRYRTLVVVDEATDFSRIQLASMFHLSHPLFKSFTMAGDLMQRVTEEGLRNWESLKSVGIFPEVFEINRVYRQSSRLLAVASALYSDLNSAPVPYTSAFGAGPGEPPPLRKRGTESEVANWISERVVDIYSLQKNLPSIAIFVARDEQVEGFADNLRPFVERHSFSVEGCPGGRVLSTESQIRVFSVKYIKGLEFEAVFFIDIDRMEQDSELFHKHLYVGLTRAASFLGVTFSEGFPTSLERVKDLFSEGDWKPKLAPAHDSLNQSNESRSTQEGNLTSRSPEPSPNMPPSPGIRLSTKTKDIAGIRMVWCPPGRFTMSAAPTDTPKGITDDVEEETSQIADIKRGFWIAVYPVTQALWESIMHHNPSHFPLGRDYPVDSVTWKDCQQFIGELNTKKNTKFRLPTELEWEYACRANTKTLFAFGDGLSLNQANCLTAFPPDEQVGETALETTSPVGVYPPNDWGIWDMHGNVWEWCVDKYLYYSSTPKGRIARWQSTERRVLRGGSWDVDARFCASASRRSFSESETDCDIGFRLVLD